MTVELVLLAFLLIQQAFYMYAVHKLLNKLMSRNYQEYTFSENLKKDDKRPSVGAKIDSEPLEDLAILNNMI